jgi:hypothetical protein
MVAGMEVAAVQALVGSVADVDERAATRAELDVAADGVRRLLGWVHAQQVRITAGLSRVASFPEDAVAKAGHVSMGEAGRLVERAATAEQTPVLAAALLDGRVGGEHVDAVSRVLRNVDPSIRPELVSRAEGLVGVAAEMSAEDWGRRLRAEARRLVADDGVTRLAQQRRDARVSTWVDHETGMWCLRGVFDPVTGASLQHALDAAVGRLFADRTPATCPADPLARQRHLQACAVADMLRGVGGVGGVGTGAPEVVVVLHAEPDGTVRVDAGIDVDIPIAEVRAMAASGRVRPIVVADGEVLWAPGDMRLGRRQRLASTSQRRALRALYRTCAVPGCQVRFERTKIHHLVEWEHGGVTDLDNLVPLCARHHSRVHDHGWQLHLGTGRRLTIRLPDGTRLRAPPNRAGP